MGMWNFSVLAVLCIAQDWPAASFATCYPTDVVLFQTPDEVIICEKCRPGYQASKLCLDRFHEQPYKELSGDQLIDLYSSYAVNFSSCVVCQAGTFASTSLGNQICKQCSYCERGEVVEESCSLTSDTKCVPQRNHKDSIWSTSVTAVAHSTARNRKAHQDHHSIRTIFTFAAILLSFLIYFYVMAIFCRTGKAQYLKEEIRTQALSIIKHRPDSCNTYEVKVALHEPVVYENTTPVASGNSDLIPSFDTRQSENGSGSGLLCENTAGHVGEITLQATKVFGYEGGTLDVAGSSVHIKVPKGAINQDETKDINVRVTLCRPNDWKCLRDSGYTTALPLIELGPNGSQFNKPIEVLMGSSGTSYTEDDVTFEFRNGSIEDKSEWLPAVKCNSRKNAKLMAQTTAPYVSFFVCDSFLHAFYLHFTMGRQKMKIPKYKWLQTAAFVKTDNVLGGRLAIKVVFYEATEEGRTLLSQEVKDFREVSITAKSIKVCHGEMDSILIAVHSITNGWALQQGEVSQACSCAPMFDPMYLGCLPSADIIVCNQCAGVSDFGCTIDVVKDGKKHHDLKILISADSIQNHIPQKQQPSLHSSGYISDDGHDDGDHCVIDDSYFKYCEPREYMMRMIPKLAEYLAGYYKPFARYLGVKECEIETAFANYPTNALEACTTLLISWLRSQPDTLNFKFDMLMKLEVAIKLTRLPFTISLPDLQHERRVPYETEV